MRRLRLSAASRWGGGANNIGTRSVFDLDCLEIFSLWFIEANRKHRYRGRGTLETDNYLVVSAGCEETADAIEDSRMMVLLVRTALNQLR